MGCQCLGKESERRRDGWHDVTRQRQKIIRNVGATTTKNQLMIERREAAQWNQNLNTTKETMRIT